MFKFFFDSRSHFANFKNLISFFYNKGKILYAELPPEVFAEKLDINFQKSVSYYINLAQNTDLAEMDEFIEEQDLFWMHEALKENILTSFYGQVEMKQGIMNAEKQVLKGELSSFEAADQLFKNHKN
jgi:hypothetical protein